MALKNLLKNVVGTVAPTLGTAIGGPVFGKKATNLIAETLGVPNNPQSIEKAISEATPEQMLQLKKAELQFEKDMAEMGVDIFALEAQEKQDARKHFSKDWTTRIMGIATLGGFLGYIFLVTLQPPEQNSEALINLVLGYLGGLASAVISFYFGASQSKEDK